MTSVDFVLVFQVSTLEYSLQKKGMCVPSLLGPQHYKLHVCFRSLYKIQGQDMSALENRCFLNRIPESPMLVNSEFSAPMQKNITWNPENGWLEYDRFQFPFGMAYFQGRTVSFREGITTTFRFSRTNLSQKMDAPKMVKIRITFDVRQSSLLGGDVHVFENHHYPSMSIKHID